MKKQDIHKSNWDILVVLDACRYDAFKEKYEDYLEGDLEKVESPATGTPEWLKNTFTEKYNYVYNSCNPFINSEDIPLSKTSSKDYDWNPLEHFEKIVDLWNSEWNDKKGTVYPKRVSRNIEKGKQTIVHYIQPHRPYLELDEDRHGWRARRMAKRHEYYSTSFLHGLLLSLKNKFFKSFWENLPKTKQDKIRSLLGITGKPSLFTEYYEKGEINVLRRHHGLNIERALEDVQRLFKNNQDKDIVITSDHGEAFGEDGRLGHGGKPHPVLNEVPWFKIKGTNRND